MPYCKKCGSELPEGAAYCQKCGTQTESVVTLRLANWGERFVAWLIDMVILSLAIAPLKAFVQFAWPSFVWAPSLPFWLPFVDFGLSNVVYFVYWMMMEGALGQSFGKMIMKTRVTRVDGAQIDLGQAAIESAGKAFLLPLDCLLGWLLYPSKDQRLFNHLSETIVIKTRR